MRKLLTILLLLAACAAPASSQERPAAGGARLVDSFGEILISDLKARLDFFAIELQNNPTDRGLIVAYSSRHKFPGWPLRRAYMSLNYLVDTRGLEAGRISVAHGGMREENSFELWSVPPSAESPVKPLDVSLFMAGQKSPLLLDRFVVEEPYDSGVPENPMPYPTVPTLYTFFADVLRRDPSLRGCIIGYTSRRGARTADRRMASRAKMTMAKSHGVDVSRVVALGGGRRAYKTIELWLVPPGAALPKPSRPARTPPRSVRR